MHIYRTTNNQLASIVGLTEEQLQTIIDALHHCCNPMTAGSDEAMDTISQMIHILEEE